MAKAATFVKWKNINDKANTAHEFYLNNGSSIVYPMVSSDDKYLPIEIIARLKPTVILRDRDLED